VSGANAVSRGATILLAIVVLALVLSSVYARVWKPDGMRVHGANARVIRVQVLNGSGAGGIGSRVGSYLRDGGFHVIEVGNADRSDYFATMVVSRQEDVEPARAVAHYLGGLPIIRQARSSDPVEVTVVLGRDRSRLRLE